MMADQIGLLGSVGLALESTWGVPVDATTYLEVSHADVRPVVQQEIPQSVRGTRARRSVRRGGMVCAGPMTFDVCAGAVGEMLKAAFGTVTTTLVASSGPGKVYQHTFTRCDTTFLPSLTVEQNMGGLTSRKVAGVRVNQLTLSLAPGRTLVADVDCRGRSETLTAPTSASYVADEPLHYNGFTAEIGGLASAEVEEFLVRIGNGLVDTVWSAGSAGLLSKLPAGAFSVGGRFAMAFESTDAHVAFVNGEPTSLRFKVAGPALVGTWGYGLELELPNVRYFSADAPLVPGRLVYDIAFEALLDTSQSPAVDAKCRVWNARVGYQT
jgi:hypothetical protein